VPSCHEAAVSLCGKRDGTMPYVSPHDGQNKLCMEGERTALRKGVEIVDHDLASVAGVKTFLPFPEATDEKLPPAIHPQQGNGRKISPPVEAEAMFFVRCHMQTKGKGRGCPLRRNR